MKRHLLAIATISALAACGSRQAHKPADAAPVAVSVAPGASGAPSSSAAIVDAGVPEAAPRAELPRGGREIFPAHRLIGFCGTPGGAPALGRLAGNLEKQAKVIEGYAEKYAKDRKPLPVFELIAVVVMGYPGPDNKFRRRVPDSVVDDYLKAAREAHALLLLNIQPGHSDFMTEVQHFAKYLNEPDVGLALDPEWALDPKDTKVVPGKEYGSVTGAALNEIGEMMAGIVAEHDLPEKLLVFHQVNNWVLKKEEEIQAHKGIVVVKSVDGLGPMGAKIKTYNWLVKTMPESVHAGFKLFFDEDTANGWQLMSPKQVLELSPVPEYVMYE
jgi:hypothetical protein